MPIYRIAGLCVDMQPRFDLTRCRAEKYLVGDVAPDMTLIVDGNEMEEYTHLAKAFYEKLLYYNGFLLHASAVELDGKAYLFSASSGTGKSTHAALWKSCFGARIINDDKPAVRLIDGVFCACGTPFSGKTDQSEPVCVPLGSIAFLQRSDENTVEPMTDRQALFALLNQTIRPSDAAEYDRLLALLERLLRQTPIYHLCCTNDPSAAHLAKDTMVR